MQKRLAAAWFVLTNQIYALRRSETSGVLKKYEIIIDDFELRHLLFIITIGVMCHAMETNLTPIISAWEHIHVKENC